MSKVFGVSLHRSGTQSLEIFLRDAGLRTCHWPSRVGEIDYESQIVGHESEPGRILDILRPALDQFEATVDVPIPALYRELDAAYPDARFIATYRSPFDWVRSARRHCAGRPFDPFERAQYWRYLDDRPTTIDAIDDERLMQMHLRHHEEMLAYFAGRASFLLADLADPELGGKISAFLGLAPREFPHIDRGKQPAAAPAAPLNTPRSRYRFHILGVPHTISTPEYNVCAFTQKVVRLCAMLKRRGHTVIHYGHPDSRVECDENVTVITPDVLREVYGDHDWRILGFPNFSVDDLAYKTFYGNAIREIGRRKQQHDFLLCPFGYGHKPVADAHGDMIVCEPGIGYPGGHFAPFKVFESYAILHAFHGLPSVARMNNSMWYDVVIPNYYDLNDFEYSDQKDDYFLFLGRIGEGKGTHIAVQIVDAIGAHLIVAGPGSVENAGPGSNRPSGAIIEHVGVAGVELRKKLMSKAKGMLLPSTYIEPFCGVHVESMLSGTPVVTTDWGAFTEYNIHGVTGYRCRTFEQFVWAAENIGNIRPAVCRDWAASNFSMERVSEMYDEYFYGVRNVYGEGGWYARNPERQNLNWLSRHWPGSNAFAAPAALRPR